MRKYYIYGILLALCAALMHPWVSYNMALSFDSIAKYYKVIRMTIRCTVPLVKHCALIVDYLYDLARHYLYIICGLAVLTFFPYYGYLVCLTKV